MKPDGLRRLDVVTECDADRHEERCVLVPESQLGSGTNHRERVVGLTGDHLALDPDTQVQVLLQAGRQKEAVLIVELLGLSILGRAHRGIEWCDLEATRCDRAGALPDKPTEM